MLKIGGNFVKLIFILGIFFNSVISSAQNDSIPKSKSAFWERVQFGGGVGLGLGNRYTNITLSPMMYYNVNDIWTLGAGLNGSYVKNKDFNYNSWIYGGSLGAIVNPVEFLQVSTELEQLRVNAEYDTTSGTINDNFWNTALFVGAGYRNTNFTIGIRYNVLHDDDDRIYSDAWMPFVRVVF